MQDLILDANNRLRIATRIHFSLLRHLGEGVDVGHMLKNESAAREVLWVCQASADAELMSLARQFDRASRPGTGQRPHTPLHAAAMRSNSPPSLT